MLKDRINEITTGYTTDDFLTAADRLERLTEDDCHRDLFAVHEKFARRLREMSGAPSKPRNAEALRSLHLFDYTTWVGRAVQ